MPHFVKGFGAALLMILGSAIAFGLKMLPVGAVLIAMGALLLRALVEELESAERKLRERYDEYSVYSVMEVGVGILIAFGSAVASLAGGTVFGLSLWLGAILVVIGAALAGSLAGKLESAERKLRKLSIR